MSRLVLVIAALAASAFFVLDDERAAATTFCVPTFGPNCPNAGGNVAEADLEKAMNTNGSDGVADQIIIVPGPAARTEASSRAAASKIRASSNRPAATR